MDETTGRTLMDEDIATAIPGSASVSDERPGDQDGTDSTDADGTDGDATDGTDGDSKDADGTDTQDTDGTDQPS